MNIILCMVKRNLKVFLRNKTAVFFSFLSVLIIIGLYAIFLGKLQEDSLKNSIGEINGVRLLVDSWIMAGLIAVNTTTASLGAMGVMVQDTENKIINDFLVAPISRTKILLSYFISSCIIGVILSMVTFIACEAYIFANGGTILSILPILKAIAIIILCVLSSTSILFFFIQFIKTENAYGTFSTILGTMIGFVAGVYVPIGVLPKAVQKIVALIPISHGTAALRQVFTEEPLAMVFKGAPDNVLNNYNKIYGIKLFWDNKEISMSVMLGILAVSSIIFIIIGAGMMRRKQKN